MGKVREALDDVVDKVCDVINYPCKHYIFPFLFSVAITNAHLAADFVNELTEYIDPLAITAIEYEISDFLAFDGFLDDPYEEELGVRILGEPTAEDLENLVAFTEKHLKRSYAELGIEEIIIFPKEDKERVDYIAQHRSDGLFLDNQIWFFSGNVDEDHFVHEVTHRRHKIKRQWLSFQVWEARWMILAGDYDKVITKQKRGMVGVVSYIDGTTDGPSFGYIRKYGGKDLKEDIATYVERIITKPYEFRRVKDYFYIYQGKLDLLLEADFITEPQYEKAVKFLEKAEEASKLIDSTKNLFEQSFNGFFFL